MGEAAIGRGADQLAIGHIARRRLGGDAVAALSGGHKAGHVVRDGLDDLPRDGVYRLDVVAVLAGTVLEVQPLPLVARKVAEGHVAQVLECEPALVKDRDLDRGQGVGRRPQPVDLHQLHVIVVRTLALEQIAGQVDAVGYQGRQKWSRRELAVGLARSLHEGWNQVQVILELFAVGIPHIVVGGDRLLPGLEHADTRRRIQPIVERDFKRFGQVEDARPAGGGDVFARHSRFHAAHNGPIARIFQRNLVVRLVQQQRNGDLVVEERGQATTMLDQCLDRGDQQLAGGTRVDP